MGGAAAGVAYPGDRRGSVQWVVSGNFQEMLYACRVKLRRELKKNFLNTQRQTHLARYVGHGCGGHELQ